VRDIRGVSGKRWILLYEEREVSEELERRFGKVLARLLVNRGVDGEAERFLRGVMPSPTLEGLEEAVFRIRRAVKEKKRILLFGDYDVDGITGTAILYEVIKAMGGKVYPLLPDRRTGYGLSKEIVSVFEKYGDFLITVDNGSSAVDEIDGTSLEVVVLDHHNVPERSPQKALVVNPKLLPPGDPMRELSSSALSYLLASLLAEEEGLEVERDRLLGLATLGLLADYVPLNAVNRALAIEGLKILEDASKGGGSLRGLSALMEEARVERVTSSEVYFSLAPRINAAGRISKPRLAFNLLLEREEDKARMLARQLEELNEKRKRLTKATFKEALKMAEGEESSFLVLWREGWHPGILGIVAGRLAEHLGKPVALFSAGSKKAVGSVRSASEEGVYERVKKLSSMFLKWGGHDKAMGITLRRTDLPRFKEEVSRLFEDFKEERGLAVDMELPVGRVEEHLREIERLEPYGEGNPYPLFMDRVEEVKEVSRYTLLLNGVPVVCWERELKEVLRKGKRFLYRVRGRELFLEDVEDGSP